MAEKEYIERNNVISHKRPFTEFDEGGWSCKVQAVAVEDIQNIPAADVAPVRHGYWIRPDVPNTRSYKWQCSECGQIAYWLHYGNRGNKNIICKYSYCPNCGAKMDGDKNGS